MSTSRSAGQIERLEVEPSETRSPVDALRRPLGVQAALKPNGIVPVPLKSFQVFDTRDPDEFAAGLSRFAGRVWLDLSGKNAKFDGRLNYVALGEVGIFHGQYTTGFKAYFPDFDSFAGSPAPLRGSGVHEVNGRDVAVSKGHGVVLSPGGVTLHYGPRFEHLSMVVQPAALIGKLAAIVGDLRFGQLHFDPEVIASAPQSKRLERLLQFMAAEVDLSRPMPPILQSELQQAMMSSFLLANANNYSALLHGEPVAAAPWQVRLAEQFIEANWDRPITIEGLVAATNVSARSLFSSFKAARGYSPMDFVKRVRLGRARQRLSRPETQTSVTAVAFECGFGNLGHFARDYHSHFGERPSETLKRGRSG
jgi:AraC-like DNA-binding protein